MGVDVLHKVLLKTLTDKKRIIMKWEDDLKLKGKLDTCYETIMV